MTDTPQVFAILLAAGSGRRVGHAENKLFLDIAGRTILERAARRLLLHPRVTQGIVVVSEDEEVRVRSLLEVISTEVPLVFVKGGKTRQESAYWGLLQASKMAGEKKGSRNIALIHDAARCFVSDRIIQDVVDTIVNERAGVAPAITPPDTTRLLDEKGLHIEQTLPRERVALMQTPQGADLDVLLQALEIAESKGVRATDDLELLIRIGYPVKLVSGEVENMKVTVKEDLPLASFFAESHPHL